ncbi:MAG: hypothetical protein ABSD47_17755, partial [Candidatus Methylomirabilota bacterium]
GGPKSNGVLPTGWRYSSAFCTDRLPANKIGDLCAGFPKGHDWQPGNLDSLIARLPDCQIA